MSIQNRISKALSVVLPAGAVGASLLLAVSSAQATPSATPSTLITNQPSVAARLKAIRTGVTELGTQSTAADQVDRTDGGELIPTWWGNGGWGRWHAGWGNGGWRLGWHNGGWRNGWHNFWHNG
jgi:rSAM-associated Gly-rich repeat protein